MEISLPKRLNVVAWVLGAALVAMSLSVIGAPLGMAVQPAMEVIGTRANPLVMPTATLLRCITAGILLLALRWMSARGMAKPGSILGRNQAVFASARVVTLVALAEYVVELAGYEVTRFFEVPFFNVTQLNVLSPLGRIFMAVALPAIGAAALVLLSPRVLPAASKES